MSESDARLPYTEIQKDEDRRRHISLAETLSLRPEGLPFPGIDEKALIALREDDKNHPGLATPIDTLISIMEKDGVQVVFGEDRESGNIFVIPKNSDDIEMDSLFPRHLKVVQDMDESFKELILINKARYERESAKAQLLNKESSTQKSQYAEKAT